MGPITEVTYSMLSRPSAEADFTLYPDPNMFSSFPLGGAQSFNMEATYSYPRAHDGYPASAGLGSSAMYPEVPQYALGSPDTRAAPSNYSTASGPSATSSAMGSPHSIQGHGAPLPEWAPQGLGLNPGIVSYDHYPHGNDYTYPPTGMDDFALEFQSKSSGFVGECQKVTRSSGQHGPILSNCESLSSVSKLVTSSIARCTPVARTRNHYTSMSMASPALPESAARSDFRDDAFSSPVSSFSASPTLRKLSTMPIAIQRAVFLGHRNVDLLFLLFLKI